MVEAVEVAVRRALAAQPAWAATPAPERGRVVGRWARLVEARADALAARTTAEMGKLPAEAAGEVAMAVRVADYYAGAGWRIEGATPPSGNPGAFVATFREPLGVVGLITPWNFPAVIPAWKLAPALVTGNAAVLKPSEVAPGAADLLVSWLLEAGLPEGVAAVVHGGGEAGAALAAHHAVAAVSFTGSVATGAAVRAAAAARGARVACELGGKNPLVILADADLDAALDAVVRGAFGTTGQRCTATARLYVQADVRAEVERRLLQAARALAVAPPASAAQAERIRRHLRAASESGLTAACGGGLAPIAPTVFLDPPHEHPIATEEVFGPVICVWTVADLDEAIARCNASPYGLSAAIFTRDAVAAMRFAHEVEAGMVHINEPTIGSEAQVPFGGFKASGHGDKELGDESLRFFTRMKTLSVRYR